MGKELMLALVLVPGLGVLAHWLAWRLRFPALVLFLAAGAIAGPVLGVIRPTEQLGPLLPVLVKLSVAVILFDGGLNLRLHELKAAATGVKRLIFPGVPLAFGLGAVAARFLGGFGWPASLVLAAILVVTGPTVILPLLRHAKLARRPASLLKWEGIVNDPIGALLAVLVLEAVTTPGPFRFATSVLTPVLETVALSAVLGVGGGLLLGRAFRRGWVPEYLKPPILFGSALLAFVLAELVQHEAGLAAATVLGMTLGNQRLAALPEIRRFKEYVALLLVASVFILLTADLDPASLLHLGAGHVAFLAAMLLAVRPLAVLLSTVRAGLPARERVLVAWIAPRGVVAVAVTGAFAGPLAAAGNPDAAALVPVVFAFVALTVALHGLTIAPLARRLGLAAKGSHGILIVGANDFTTALAGALHELEVSVLLADTRWADLRPARMAGVPVRYGEVLSRTSEETLDLAHVSTLLAATGNDAYNALVCTSFAHEVGRDRAFQLPLLKSEEEDPGGLHLSVRGRLAFEEDAVLPRLLRNVHRGFVIHRTHLTPDFGPDRFRESLPEEVVLLLAVKRSGAPALHTARTPLSPEPGDVVLWHGPPAN